MSKFGRTKVRFSSCLRCFKSTQYVFWINLMSTLTTNYTFRLPPKWIIVFTLFISAFSCFGIDFTTSPKYQTFENASKGLRSSKPKSTISYRNALIKLRQKLFLNSFNFSLDNIRSLGHRISVLMIQSSKDLFNRTNLKKSFNTLILHQNSDEDLIHSIQG